MAKGKWVARYNQNLSLIGGEELAAADSADDLLDQLKQRMDELLRTNMMSDPMQYIDIYFDPEYEADSEQTKPVVQAGSAQE
jgi:hypothetical protein